MPMLEPKDQTNATNAEFIATVCTKCPLLRDWPHADVLGLAANVATLAYGDDLPAVWSLLDGVGMDRHQGRAFAREVLVSLYPAAVSIPAHSEPDGEDT
ncbi:hypothetical protein [Demequina muriae]|uniref:Uncharacterized protein n=1 Tax=Demequina muriae TaxID=3051664 RepID=A0ABT8GEP3_9MICO|nr:hypothetical protein [Demequina sp. EGI L300058]MDN4479908.1 hypothetical protein [Demequina sp. EGI L300058]